MPASVCQHESGRFIGPVKDKPRRYWHYRIAQFPAFQRQTAAFSADLTLELSKSHQSRVEYSPEGRHVLSSGGRLDFSTLYQCHSQTGGNGGKSPGTQVQHTLSIGT